MDYTLLALGGDWSIRKYASRREFQSIFMSQIAVLIFSQITVEKILVSPISQSLEFAIILQHCCGSC